MFISSPSLDRESVALILKNKAGLRIAGVSPLRREFFATMARNPGLSVAAVGRICGITRQHAHSTCRWLQDNGWLIRFGRVVMVCKDRIRRLAGDAVAARKELAARLLREKHEAAKRKALKLRADLENVISPVTHARETVLEKENAEKMGALASRLEREGNWSALAALWSA